MARKKETNLAISAEETSQVQDLLEHYHQIADTLHTSADQQQAETALVEITNLSETSQLALLKALSKEQHSDAADILLALNTLADNKQVRKEARRSLIRLEGARIYPAWHPPVAQTPLIQLPVANAPRFWKGYITASREEGEIQLILCWEHGFEYNEVRMMIFLLDFWEQGLKEFILDNTNKRNVDAQLQQLRTRLPDVTIAECTLAEARRFIEEALAVNAWRGTEPHKEYRHHLPTVKQLILDAQDVGEDRGLTFINPKLEADELVATCITGWALGDYGLAYDLLASDSPLRDGLEREEWVARRRQWADEAHPTRFEFGFIHEREPNTASTLWLPTTFGASRNLSSRKELEMAWSLELTDTPLSGTLPEMPMGTAVYKETGRHWFWTSYTVVQEQEVWRIRNMTDEGAKAQGLPISELQQRIHESDERVNELMQQHTPGTPEAKETSEEVIRRLIQTLHYDDALIVHLPLDQTFYGDAFNRAMGIGALERAIVYLERMVRSFAQGRGAALRQLGITQASLSEFYGERRMPERAQRFYELAEASLRESLEVENSIAGHAILADLLIQAGKLDEAEAELQQAKEMAPAPKEEAMIENSLAIIAMHREQPQEGLRHYQHAAALDPNFENIWFRIGLIQAGMNELEDAKASYERAIESEPHFILAYSELAAIYMKHRQSAQARETLERGIRSNPQSAHLLALLSSVYLESGDIRHAQAVLEEAEHINPQLEIVQAIREELNRRKKR